MNSKSYSISDDSTYMNMSLISNKQQLIDTNNTSKKIITSNSKSNLEFDEIIEINLNNCINEFSSIFINTILIEDIEPGFISDSERIFHRIVKKYEYYIALLFIDKIFLEYAKHIKVVKSILFILSEIHKDKIKRNAFLIPSAALNLNDNEVKDLALSCYEKWGNKEYLEFLKQLNFDEEWLNSYLQEIIYDLEK